MRPQSLILILLGVVLLIAAAIVVPTVAVGLLLVAATSVAAIYALRAHTEEKRFVTNLFLAALLLRMAFGAFLQIYGLRDFFGGDAATYDALGWRLSNVWFGYTASDPSIERVTSFTTPGWGMYYLTAAVYSVIGRNLYAAQSLCAVVGAATAPLVYLCAQKIFLNKTVAKTSALAIAFFPTFIIWSSQFLKDGLIIFLLVLSILIVMRLQEKLSYPAIGILVLALFGILSLRFYIFYMVAVAVAGSLVVGTGNSRQSVFARLAVIVLVGVALTYFGVVRNASSDIAEYTDLERVQRSRLDLARSAESGFGEDIDVSTTAGAIRAIPIGFAYLMFAPFPWQVSNVRQALTLPEVFVWWATFPFIIGGIVFAVRHRLRSALPILIFSLLLTIAYSVFQGNVGTAYRQRTQIQVFLFIFAAVGLTIYKERRDDRRALVRARRLEIDRRLRSGV